MAKNAPTGIAATRRANRTTRTVMRRGMPRRRRRAPRLSFLGSGRVRGGASARTLERAMGAVWVLPRKCSPLWRTLVAAGQAGRITTKSQLGPRGEGVRSGFRCSPWHRWHHSGRCVVPRLRCLGCRGGRGRRGRCRGGRGCRGSRRCRVCFGRRILFAAPRPAAPGYLPPASRRSGQRAEPR